MPLSVPVGLDAYRLWDEWPDQRIGVRTYLRSTYDRAGGNEGADASHFLYQLSDADNVTLDVAGAGVLYFVRFNHWHGSPWHFVIDGDDHIVSESSTSNPESPVEGSAFLPENLFPEPLAYTWSTTNGADLIGVPMPFEKSLQIAYTRTHYGTGYYIYQQFVPGIALSQPLQPWSGLTPPDSDVLQLIDRAGSDIAPAPSSLQGVKDGVFENGVGPLALHTGFTTFVYRMSMPSPQVVRALEISAPRSEAVSLGLARLRITWDDRSSPSVDAPIALFFGAGTLYNRDGKEYLVKAFPVSVRFDPERVNLACYFPMPFFHSIKIELVDGGAGDVDDVMFHARFAPFHGRPNQVGYFHATYCDQGTPIPGRDLVLLDTRKTEGGGDWSGSLVGTSFIFSDRANLTTLEGDPRFFFDDSQSPQVQGTGTEEWAGGGDYWGGQNMTLPFYGHPTGARDASSALCEDDKIESAYRFLLADLMPFGKDAVIGLEHGGTDESTEHYQTVAYWYGLPAPSLIETDSLQLGSADSEASHDYVSPDASAPYSISSRYEWGVDTLDGKEIYPAQTDVGRTTIGTSEFTMKLVPNNLGVMLRRKLDYSFPDQRAEVYVAAQVPGALKWQPAGIWYTAGSNTDVYSNPSDELGAAQHIVQTSNRRFRDDEFLLPLSLTKGQSSIRIRIRFTPVMTPLYPGCPLAPLAWSEIRYDVYCFVMPDFSAV